MNISQLLLSDKGSQLFVLNMFLTEIATFCDSFYLEWHHCNLQAKIHRISRSHNMVPTSLLYFFVIFIGIFFYSNIQITFKANNKYLISFDIIKYVRNI